MQELTPSKSGVQVKLELHHLAQYLASWKLLGNEFLLSDLAYMVIYAKHAQPSSSSKHRASEVSCAAEPQTMPVPIK